MSLNQILLCDLISSQVLLTITLKFVKMVQSAGSQRVKHNDHFNCSMCQKSYLHHPVSSLGYGLAVGSSPRVDDAAEFFCVPCFSVGVSGHLKSSKVGWLLQKT